MYRAASGIQQEPAKRGPRTDEVEVTSRDSPKFKIFFPSQKTVQQSRGGAGYPSRPNLSPLNILTTFHSCGGTICLQSNHWNNPAFPKPLIYDCKNTRKGLLMHNKVSAPFPLPSPLPIHKFSCNGFNLKQFPLNFKLNQLTLSCRYFAGGLCGISEMATEKVRSYWSLLKTLARIIMKLSKVGFILEVLIYLLPHGIVSLISLFKQILMI
jgi:hypothetical protein